MVAITAVPGLLFYGSGVTAAGIQALAKVKNRRQVENPFRLLPLSSELHGLRFRDREGVRQALW